MIKYKTIVRLFLELSLLLVFTVTSYASENSIQQSPSIKKGVMDLKNWDFDSDGFVALSGEWEFYWNQFLFPKSDQLNSENKHFISLPGLWNDYFYNNQTLSGHGFATLRTKILFKEEGNKKLALKLTDVYSAYTIYINGEKVGQAGSVGESPSTSLEINRPMVLDFFTNEQAVEIIIHISNFGFVYGGSPQVIELGSQADIHLLREKNIAFELAVVGAIGVIALYHFIGFSLRREDRAALFFSLLSISIIVYSSTVGELFLLQLLGINKFSMMLRILLVSTASSGLFLLSFFYSLYTGYLSNRLVRCLQILLALMILSGLVAPVSLIPTFHLVNQLLIIVSCIVSIYALVAALIKKKFEARIALGGFLIFFFTILNDILVYHALIDNFYLGHFGILVVIFSQATLLRYRFNSAFFEIEALSFKLEANNSRLLELDALKNDFLAKTSHELRTPLNGIIGIADTLIDKSQRQLSDNVVSSLKLIISSASRLSALINDILDFSRLKHEDIKLNQRPVDVRAVAELTVRLLNPLAVQKGLKLINSIENDLPLVQADENRLHQILHNLIGNAIKFTETGFVELKARLNKNEIQISIEDTGIGIPENKLNDVFISFEQVETSYSRMSSGTGLGLSITKHLVELHKGSILIESVIGVGTKVCFTLAITEQTSLPTRESSGGLQIISNENGQWDFDPGSVDITSDPFDPKIHDPSKPGILVVDDEPINLEILVNRISIAGYNVIAARSGFDALEILEDRKADIDLALLDIMMPQMNGLELLHKIREYDDLSSLPVIMITALNQFETMIEALKLGANDYLTKPFKKEELLARINNHLSVLENQKLKQSIEVLKNIEQDLYFSKDKISQVINVLSDGVVIINSDQKIVQSNPSSEQFLDYLPHEIQGENLKLIMSEEAQAMMFEGFTSKYGNDHPKKVYFYRNVPLKGKNNRILSTPVSVAKIGDPKKKEFVLLFKFESSMKGDDYRHTLVKAMIESLSIYENSTNKTKADLAIESGLWKYHTHDGRVRTKTLDRYLNIDSLPKRPRWKDVLATIRFVLSLSEVPSAQKERLQRQLNDVTQIISSRSLNE